MPSNLNTNHQARHSDDMQDIITVVPAWILRWGITLFFCILVLLLSLSAFIKYPDIVKTKLKISSPNIAKPIIPKVTGKLDKLLVTNNQTITTGQPLAYIESTANHDEVLTLLASLLKLQQASPGGQIDDAFFNKTANNNLGELQGAYQTFIQSYLAYKASIENGFLVKKRTYLLHDIEGLNKQTGQLQAEKLLQQRDADLAKEEYDMHQKLEKQKVETPAELRQQESKYISRKAPLLQTDAALITSNTNLLAKQKEILELDNQVAEERSKFSQALNSLISQAEDWKNKYVLYASQAGRVIFAGNIQENQVVSPAHEVFYVSNGNEKFFGEMNIPQDDFGKVKQGQKVLVKLRSYRFEEFGMLNGKIAYIADVPFNDSIFLSKVVFTSKTSDMKKPVVLKQGMIADAEIVTEDATVLQRLTRNVIKAMKSN
ncbi:MULTISPECIES: HlyD family efflux transporter periplasmic adaptor subunit [unclassified Mucilaginibacter]|uniref:HlyD family secretion protein n=1 Tax=unclassified Mucilaginibacter TaxID=2617802 RepID=UPI002AC8F41E|nr:MULTISPECIES: HlyD family efflux transporter periplasmic adaptor subunit [unclassified Mucilaginibacter]MEB0260875.1 HlyD family efflux transporter periplasmic adaptor subunit [Mucilaginibacter sp. 10I4]MEB0279890.1 HlyD family efflux transporter periplasmic adaptor subunit [Mucilaginibacter sp. 10B2]MEB0302849.1 HlyD family efflux transporter periplasmic adaptor subunit [Mucilaginibacter sp. 5C4]WPX24137.1 HlyD family efflux transporter periplasmic adaptor subunit [Mucilaginibacter sp. 5C4]